MRLTALDSAMADLLSGWHDFYVIVGSSAAALTGLNFVVIALGADGQAFAGPAVQAFATPTIVHFGAALLVAGIVTAPWPSPAGSAWSLAVTGAAGLVYAVWVVRQSIRQTQYKPVAEDVIWHMIIPVIAYALLTLGGVVVSEGSVAATFAVAVAALLLMFIGIHNAWDSAMYLAQRKAKQ